MASKCLLADWLTETIPWQPLVPLVKVRKKLWPVEAWQKRLVQSALSNHIRRISHRMTANHSKHSMSTWWLHSRLDKRYFTRLRIRRKDFFKMLRWANELSLTLMKFQPGYNFWFLSPVAWREHVDQDGGIGRMNNVMLMLDLRFELVGSIKATMNKAKASSGQQRTPTIQNDREIFLWKRWSFVVWTVGKPSRTKFRHQADSSNNQLNGTQYVAYLEPRENGFLAPIVNSFRANCGSELRKCNNQKWRADRLLQYYDERTFRYWCDIPVFLNSWGWSLLYSATVISDGGNSRVVVQTRKMFISGSDVAWWVSARCQFTKNRSFSLSIVGVGCILTICCESRALENLHLLTGSWFDGLTFPSYSNGTLGSSLVSSAVSMLYVEYWRKSQCAGISVVGMQIGGFENHWLSCSWHHFGVSQFNLNSIVQFAG